MVKGKNYELNPIEFPSHNMTVAIESTKKGEGGKTFSCTSPVT
jgi:elongation factor G